MSEFFPNRTLLKVNEDGKTQQDDPHQRFVSDNLQFRMEIEDFGDGAADFSCL